jgi:hypothetical protein
MILVMRLSPLAVSNHIGVIGAELLEGVVEGQLVKRDRNRLVRREMHHHFNAQRTPYLGKNGGEGGILGTEREPLLMHSEDEILGRRHVVRRIPSPERGWEEASREHHEHDHPPQHSSFCRHFPPLLVP